MLVVSDASPLRYLILVESADVLPKMFGRVVAPPEVITELSQPKTPEAVRTWISARPAWLEVQGPAETMEAKGLGLGERQAISLAQEIRAEAVLLDDRDAVKEARSRGLMVLGTLALLDEAASRGLIGDLHGTLERLLKETNFRRNPTTDGIMRAMLRREFDRRHSHQQDQAAPTHEQSPDLKQNGGFKPGM
jgi:predicted nucleic acid-binding protein